jgi:hypothetical protein
MSSVATGFAVPRLGRTPILTTLLFLCPLLTAIAPRLAPFLLPLLAVALITIALRRGSSWRDLIHPNQALLAIGIVALYAGGSALWAEDVAAAVSKSAVLLAATVLTLPTLAATTALDDDELRRSARAFVSGSLLGALFVFIEVLTNGALTRAVMNVLPVLQPGASKHVSMMNGLVTRLNASEFNQHVAMLSFQLWPGLLALLKLAAGRRRTALLALYSAALALPIALSQHESSQIGIIVGALVLLLAYRWPRQTIRTLAVAWCLGFVVVLPLDFLAYRAELHQAEWLPRSARARVILWQYTAERVLENPWLGIGADSTAKVRDERIGKPETPKGFVFRRTTGQHAHSIFLQTWYELGFFGVVLVAIAGAAVALRMLLLPKMAQPFAAASFAGFMAIAALAWGMWQIWLICAVALLPVYMSLASAPFCKREKDGGSEGAKIAS